MNPAGIAFSMRTVPLLIPHSASALVYPTGGINTVIQPGCAVCVSIRHRRKGSAQKPVVQEILVVHLWKVSPALDDLCQELTKRQWETLWLWRKPLALYEFTRERLQGLRLVPDDWDDATIATLAADMLRRAPVSAPAEYLAYCEQHPAARKALSCAIAGLAKMAGQATTEAPVLGRTTTRSWYGPQREELRND